LRQPPPPWIYENENGRQRERERERGGGRERERRGEEEEEKEKSGLCRGVSAFTSRLHRPRLAPRPSPLPLPPVSRPTENRNREIRAGPDRPALLYRRICLSARLINTRGSLLNKTCAVDYRVLIRHVLRLISRPLKSDALDSALHFSRVRKDAIHERALIAQSGIDGYV